MRTQRVLSVNAWLLAFPRLLFLLVGNVTVKPNFVSLYCCPCLPVCFSGLYIQLPGKSLLGITSRIVMLTKPFAAD